MPQERLRAEAAEVVAKEDRAIGEFNAAKREQEGQEDKQRAVRREVADRCVTLSWLASAGNLF